MTISSDFMTGFCGESEEEHNDTVSLMKLVQFDMAYMFAYSMRKVIHSIDMAYMFACSMRKSIDMAYMFASSIA